ncbi:hypothetical protein VOLCADRAFT_108504 [Volvox carteri f. nagariensis]|uniref:Uncharacterized protein n=1 Tax=Volvox carteri f. nagariensis TaxID=3068 RepID=D8UKH6_VOLCA|nr:uncharacterized protein VOLCADRAFT_108504 [Volvox carteri f. nagariensis]EFJ39786.1 hypothetical protein VOLCADRAFT_108504 [Volvox carteri f. nagariensis]|eukprot:XP_002959163.1 hypothetical protein VOLCADRAFT_108504 [Volvox carteri f. nagariensis]
MNLQQMLTDLFSKRKALKDQLQRELQKYQAKKVELGQDLDEYDQAATEIIAVLTIAVQQLQGKSESQELHECLEKMEFLRSSHSKSHQSLEQLCSMVGNLISLVVELDVLHHELRKQIMLSGTWDHVTEIRLFAYYDMVDRNPALKQKYSSLSTFLDTLHQECTDFVNGRIRTQPLNSAFGEAVQHLGLSNTEWQLLKTLNKDSMALFHKKFMIEELETEVFPADLEPCRGALMRAARMVNERCNAMAAGPQAPSDDDNWA